VVLIFDGAIAGVGTESGTRLVVGMWPSSPLGAFADVMVERPDGWRIFLAPSDEVADFVSATYRFDEIRVVPVEYRRDGNIWSINAGPLTLRLSTAGRGPLGLLLSAIPARLARARWWSSALDPIAKLVLPGVRTRGTAGGGRREWYAALDLHRISSIESSWDGADLGGLRDVDPPVRFGFGSTPATPSLVRVRTTIDLGSGRSADPSHGGHAR
jgi:hypothetical protein